MKKSHLIILSTLALGAASCSRHDGWTLKGTVPDGTTQVYVEAPTTDGGWYALDSVAPSGGSYTFELPRARGSIYRVSFNDNTFYVPADSTETITLSVDGIRSGSTEALLFNRVDSVINAGGDTKAMLRALDGNYASVAAYYATQLSGDYQLLRTVANRHSEERPELQRTAVLLARQEQAARERAARTNENSEPIVISAPEIGYYEIELPDRNGKMRKLSEVVEANPLCVLAFADFERPENAVVTMALGEAAEQGAAIYEVGFDRNQQLWANRSASLPWVNVYQSEVSYKPAVTQYVVSELPTLFVIRDGVITERVADPTKLTESLK